MLKHKDRVEIKLPLFQTLLLIITWSRHGNAGILFGSKNSMSLPSAWYVAALSINGRSNISFKLPEQTIEQIYQLLG